MNTCQQCGCPDWSGTVARRQLEEHERAVPAVLEWIESGMQKPADIAFTEGAARQVAYACEMAVRKATEHPGVSEP